MLSVSQSWKEKLGNYLTPNRDLLTPEEFIKIEYNIDGQTLVFDKSDIISFSHTNSADLNSLTLPKNEIRFEIDNTDDRWNPDNPQGLYQKIAEKQKVDLYYGAAITSQEEVEVTNDLSNSVWGYTSYSSSGQIIDDEYWTFDDNDWNEIEKEYATATPGTRFLWGVYVSADSISSNGTYTVKVTARNSAYEVILTESKSFNYSPETLEFGVKGATTLPTGTVYFSYEITSGLDEFTGIKVRPYVALWNRDAEDFTEDYIPLETTITTTVENREEWHKAGTFYMSGWDCPQNGLTASFTATSQLDFGKDKFGEVTYSDEPTCKDVCETAANNMGLYTTNYYVWQKWNVESIASYSKQIDRTHYISQGYTSQVITDIPPVGNRQIYYSSAAPTLNSETGKLNFIISGSSYSGVDISGSNSFCIAELGHSVGTTIQVPQVVSSFDLFSLYSDGIMEYAGYQGENAPSLTYVQTTYAPGKGSISYGEVNSTNSSAYPQNGKQGDYWYVYNRQEEPNVIIDSVLNNYNVPYKTGTTYTVDIFKDTTVSAVIQYCANAGMCRIRYDADGKIYIEPMETGGVLSDYVIDLFTSYHQPEYVLSKQIKNVIINSELTVALETDGENQQISNSLITEQVHANLFAGWLGRVLNTRKTISGEYRCDPRIQPYDYVKTINKYAVNETFITDVAISYSGSFKATYTGRVMKSVPSQDVYGLLYAGDKQRAGNTIS